MRHRERWLVGLMHGAEDLDYYPPVLLYMYNEALNCYKFCGGFYAYGVTKYVGIPILIAALMIV